MKFATPLALLAVLFVLVPASQAAAADPKSGTVAESIEARSYTYLRLAEPEIWIATTPLEVAEGDHVEYTGGMEMRDFHSKALDRTFESIWFVQNVNVVGRDMEQLHQSVSEDHGAEPPIIPQPVTVSIPAPGEIEKLSGGKDIAEIVSGSEALEGQTVNVRARVIKVNDDIMGKNWVTLQDGSGTAPNDKLLATSLETVIPGELVTVEGTVRNNVDLGSGYRYAVLLEEATFTK